MEILVVAVLISSISIYGTIKLKRFYFMLGYFLFSILAITSLMPTFNEDPYLSITSLALFLVLGIANATCDISNKPCILYLLGIVAGIK